MNKLKVGDLKVGDTVLWSGSWGEDKEEEAVIERIEVDSDGEEGGTEVDTVDWGAVVDRTVVVILTNNHWAYGFQIKPFIIPLPKKD